jgi:hypothetical protein
MRELEGLHDPCPNYIGPLIGAQGHAHDLLYGRLEVVTYHVNDLVHDGLLSAEQIAELEHLHTTATEYFDAGFYPRAADIIGTLEFILQEHGRGEWTDYAHEGQLVCLPDEMGEDI